VLIVESGRRRSVREVRLEDIGSTEYRPRSNGGDLVLGGSRNFVATMYANTGLDVFGSFYRSAPIAFFDVPDIDQAKLALDRAQVRS
jgi:hypothetical protein